MSNDLEIDNKKGCPPRGQFDCNQSHRDECDQSAVKESGRPGSGAFAGIIKGKTHLDILDNTGWKGSCRR